VRCDDDCGGNSARDNHDDDDDDDDDDIDSDELDDRVSECTLIPLVTHIHTNTLFAGVKCMHVRTSCQQRGLGELVGRT
jgi:hypothetical protein